MVVIVVPQSVASSVVIVKTPATSTFMSSRTGAAPVLSSSQKADHMDVALDAFLHNVDISHLDEMLHSDAGEQQQRELPPLTTDDISAVLHGSSPAVEYRPVQPNISRKIPAVQSLAAAKRHLISESTFDEDGFVTDFDGLEWPPAAKRPCRVASKMSLESSGYSEAGWLPSSVASSTTGTDALDLELVDSEHSDSLLTRELRRQQINNESSRRSREKKKRLQTMRQDELERLMADNEQLQLDKLRLDAMIKRCRRLLRAHFENSSIGSRSSEDTTCE